MAKPTLDKNVTDAKRDTNFDPAAIARELAELEGEHKRISEKQAAILYDVQQHHPEHLNEICKLAGIGRSC
jgi:UDP-N-acetylmuramate-alanine ligase